MPRKDYVADLPALAVEEGLLNGHLEADYLLFLDGKAVGVLEAKSAENKLGLDVIQQAKKYTRQLPTWCKCWQKPLPFVYLSNGEKLLFRDLRDGDSPYVSLRTIHTADEMRQLLQQQVFPPLPVRGLRACQREAILNLEQSVLKGLTRTLLILATGAGKTFAACMAIYRLLVAKKAKRVLFLVDRRNLGEQAEAAFGTFRLTESKDPFSLIYPVVRATGKPLPPESTVVISTIQRLYSLLTGDDIAEPEDDEIVSEDGPRMTIQSTLAKLPPDYFDLIFVDECHRSIYGRWQEVLTYFNKAHIVGLTATPSDETKEFFGKNIACNYTYEQSVVDGINVDYRIYRIRTLATELGGLLHAGEQATQVTRYTGEKTSMCFQENAVYTAAQLDKEIENPTQIRLVLETYREAVYREMFPSREANFACLPKTLIFAKSVPHAKRIVEIAREVFPGQHENFVQHITCSAEDPQQLIRDFNNDSHFRIAVTVTLVATGTDIPPLEVLLFMRNVESEQLFVQMRGRGVRTMSDDKLRALTPNAHSKDEFFLVDAIGVTEHAMRHSQGSRERGEPVLTLKDLLEKVSHGFLPDENLRLLASRLARIARKSTLAQQQNWSELAGVAMDVLATTIYDALEMGTLPEFLKGQDNPAREQLVEPLSKNPAAREELLKLNAGFLTILDPGEDQLIFNGFAREEAIELTDAFKNWLGKHRATHRVVQLLCDLQGVAVTYEELQSLSDDLRQANKQFKSLTLWGAYQTLFPDKVTALTPESKVAQTNLISLVRFALHLRETLKSPYVSMVQAYELWKGQKQRDEPINDKQDFYLRGLLSNIAVNGLLKPADFWDEKELLYEGNQLFGSSFADVLCSLSRFILSFAA